LSRRSKKKKLKLWFLDSPLFSITITFFFTPAQQQKGMKKKMIITEEQILKASEGEVSSLYQILVQLAKQQKQQEGKIAWLTENLLQLIQK